MGHVITSLTDAQKATFPAYVKEWTDIGLSMEPADRPRAEAAIGEMYRIGGLKEPTIVWCGSPFSMALTRAVLQDETVQRAIREARSKAGLPPGNGASVGDSVWASVRDSVGDSVRDSVGDSVRDSVGASVWYSVWASVGDSVGDSVWDSVWDSVGDSVGDSVWDSVWDSVGDSVRDSVGASVGDSVWASVGDSVWDSVWDSVGASVGDSVWASVRDSVGDSVRDSVYGQHDASWLSFYWYFRNECGLRVETEKLGGLWELARSAGWALPCEGICFVSERHNVLHRDEAGHLHCEDGPALTYPDGFAIYAVHGVRVPSAIIESPDTIKIDAIHEQRNTEIQRVMIERYGWDRYADDCGAEIVDHDERWGTLCRRRVGRESIMFLRVVNGSPEPDGSFRRYILPLAANLEPLPDPEDPTGELGAPQDLTALNAVASTYGLRGDEYAELVVRT